MLRKLRPVHLLLIIVLTSFIQVVSKSQLSHIISFALFLLMKTFFL